MGPWDGTMGSLGSRGGDLICFRNYHLMFVLLVGHLDWITEDFLRRNVSTSAAILLIWFWVDLPTFCMHTSINTHIILWAEIDLFYLVSRWQEKRKVCKRNTAPSRQHAISQGTIEVIWLLPHRPVCRIWTLSQLVIITVLFLISLTFWCTDQLINIITHWWSF